MQEVYDICYETSKSKYSILVDVWDGPNDGVK